LGEAAGRIAGALRRSATPERHRKSLGLPSWHRYQYFAIAGPAAIEKPKKPTKPHELR
jgi:hypothetical protein